MGTRTEEGIGYAYMAAMQKAEQLHCFMHDSDPVSPKSYWLPVSLIPTMQPMGVLATLSVEGMKGQKGVGVGAAAGTKN